MTAEVHKLNGAMGGCQFSEDHMTAIIETTKSIENLEGHLEQLVNVATECRDNLLNSATGRNHIDKETFKEVLGQAYSSSKDTLKGFHRAYGLIIAVLLFTIAFILTGQKLGWINTLQP